MLCLYFLEKIRYTVFQIMIVKAIEWRTFLCSGSGEKYGKITILCEIWFPAITTIPSRTAMVFQALDEICHEFDLSQPIWLDSNIRDFQLHDKTRFTKDSFIESIDFDYLEFQVIEE